MGQALAVVQKFFDHFAANEMDAADELFAEDCVTVTPVAELNKAEHRGFGEAFKAALPDARMEVVRAVESGNEVFLAGRFRGKHTGALTMPQGSVPASGNEIDVPFADYFRVENGQIAAHETYWDQMAMMGQLGALPG